MDWNHIEQELYKKLDPKHVKKPEGKFGPKGDWLEGWHVIDEANRIFGFGGWSYESTLEKISLEESADRNGNQQWQAAYTCMCTVTVDGVTRQDVGFGSGFSKQIGDAVEGATKEAVTDALKRCLRTFGNRFGLALYDKARTNVGVDQAPAHERIVGKISSMADPAELAKFWNQKSVTDALKAMDEDTKRTVIAAYSAKFDALTPVDEKKVAETANGMASPPEHLGPPQ